MTDSANDTTVATLTAAIDKPAAMTLFPKGKRQKWTPASAPVAAPPPTVEAVCRTRENAPVAFARRRRREEVGLRERKSLQRAAVGEAHRPRRDGVSARIAQERGRARETGGVVGPADTGDEIGGGRRRVVQRQLRVAL